jgi:hypothetical protein
VSRAMARGRPAWVFSASRALSMTDWWYSYEPWEKFMRTTLRPAGLLLAWVHDAEQKLFQHTSSEHVDGLGRVGLGTCILSARTLCACCLEVQLTNGADDGTATELALGDILSVELREPLGSGAASLEVCNCVGHLVCV